MQTELSFQKKILHDETVFWTLIVSFIYLLYLSVSTHTVIGRDWSV